MNKEKKESPKREFISTVYVVNKNKVLLTFNKNVKKFIPLGGHIDPNELPCQAAIREAKEESGYEIELLDLDGKTSLEKTNLKQNFDIQLDKIGEDHHHINISYIGKIVGGEMRKESDEGTALKWFSKKELKNIEKIFENTREKALKALKLTKNNQKGEQ